jgi:N-acetylglucosaminyldiphosphoundecaprenol N-acetyl-beta-D-mannosaminyltransferase
LQTSPAPPIAAAAPEVERFDVLGVPVAAATYDTALRLIINAANQQRPFLITALAVHGVMTGALDRIQRTRLRKFDLILPDGQPVRWALSWLHGQRLPDRVYGPELMRRLCAESAKRGIPVFLYGSTAKVIERLSRRLVREFPGLSIAGAEPSQFRNLEVAERDAVIDRIRKSGAKIIFVGLGCPRQEVWTYENAFRLELPVVAVGAAFAFHAGVLPQAPGYLQERGLEWAYRLFHEPVRLWRRYLLLNPLYLFFVLCQIVGLRLFGSSAEHIPEHRFG